MHIRQILIDLDSSLRLRYAVSVSILLMALTLVACVPTPGVPPTPTTPPLAKELTIYYWENGIPQEILEAFTKEYGVQIRYEVMSTTEEGIASLASGKVYDVTLFSGNDIPKLIGDRLLAKIDLNNVRNFKNVMPNFRDLAYDPDNEHTVPYLWGTTGIVYRKDLVSGEIKSWADLWDPRYQGKVGYWRDKRTMIGLALKMDGHSLNSESAEDLEAAYRRLSQLKGQAIALEEIDLATSANALSNGTVSLVLGWSYDLVAGQELNSAISYALPQEGTLLWSEDLVIPANSPNKYTAELFIDYMMRSETSAKMSEGTGYATTNTLAAKFINAELLKNTAVFPTNEMLKNAEVFLPVSPEAEKKYNDIWSRFLELMKGS